MKKTLARWIVTFCGVWATRPPRKFLPLSWSVAMDRAEMEERNLDRRLRTPPPQEGFPDPLRAEIDRVLRHEPTRESTVTIGIPRIAIAAAAALLLAGAVVWYQMGDSPSSTPTAESANTPPDEAVVYTVEMPPAARRSIAAAPADWEEILREEQERIASDGLNAIRFLASNFVPDPLMDEVDTRLERWETHVSPDH